ncbi:MAG: PAS domain S-box protein [Gemmatimonadota bacterium]|nr:MAG: PAS domain S-box protein [Gemmatimonadota bacterium]
MKNKAKAQLKDEVTELKKRIAMLEAYAEKYVPIAEALQKSEEKYHKLLEALQEGVWAIDKDAYTTFVNPRMAELLGYSMDEMQGKHLFEFMDEKGRAIAKHNLDKRKQGIVEQHEFTFLKKNGTSVSALLETAPIFDKDGNYAGAIAGVIDITQRKQVEEALKESTLLLETILDHTHMLVAYMDHHFNFVKVNRAYAMADEREPSFFPGKNHFDLYPNPENKEIFRRVVETGEAYFARAKPFEYAEHPERGVTYWDWSLVPIKDQGNTVIGLVLTLTNITDRVKSHQALEERTQELGERVKELNCLYSIAKLVATPNITLDEILQGCVDLIPPAWQYPDITCARIIVKGEEFRTKNFQQTIWQQATDIVVQSKRMGSIEIFYMEERPQRDEGPFLVEERNLLTAIAERLGRIIERTHAEEELEKYREHLEELIDEKTAELKDTNEKLRQEIVERQKAEEELRVSQEELRNLAMYLQSVRESERTTIAREIHDELGQTLTALKMDLSWFHKRLGDDQKPWIEKIESMSELVNTTIQTVKRISTELRPGVLDDLGLVAAIEWLVNEVQSRTGVTCELTIDPEDFLLDRDRSTALFRIFQETMTNIARHSGATRVMVHLEKKGDLVELRVQDNGRGITDEESSDHQSFGLIGMRERVHFFGGELAIHGTAGQGTTVVARIPHQTLERVV